MMSIHVTYSDWGLKRMCMTVDCLSFSQFLGRKAWKNSGQTGSQDPNLCDAWCSAPPVELIGQLRTGRYVGRWT